MDIYDRVCVCKIDYFYPATSSPNGLRQLLGFSAFICCMTGYEHAEDKEVALVTGGL